MQQHLLHYRFRVRFWTGTRQDRFLWFLAAVSGYLLFNRYTALGGACCLLGLLLCCAVVGLPVRLHFTHPGSRAASFLIIFYGCSGVIPFYFPRYCFSAFSFVTFFPSTFYIRELVSKPCIFFTSPPPPLGVYLVRHLNLQLHPVSSANTVVHTYITTTL